MEAPLRRGPGSLYRRLATLRFAGTRDRGALFEFLLSGHLRRPSRLALVRDFMRVTNAVRGYHTLSEMLAVAGAILERDAPTVVEAGCGTGASTAKLSLAVRAADGELHVFDSFKGLPENSEEHRNLDGRRVRFRAGAFRCTLARVRRTVARYGAPEVCHFHKGWFENSLRQLCRPIDVALVDVDLLESTRTCLSALMPALAPDGVLFSQDGHLEATHELFADPAFWGGIGVAPPAIEGLWRQKFLRLSPVGS